MTKRIDYIISIFPLVDILVGIGMLTVLMMIESQTKIVTDNLNLPYTSTGMISVEIISIIVKISSVSLIFISILKFIRTLKKGS